MTSGPDARTLGLPLAIVVATVVLIAANAIGIELVLETTRKGHVRYLHHLYAAGQHLAVGLIAATLSFAWTRWGPRRGLWGLALLALVSVPLGLATLVEDLTTFVGGFARAAAARALQLSLAVALSLVAPALAWLGHKLARPGWRWLGVAFAAALMALNHTVLPENYPSAHLFLAIYAVTLLAVSLAGAVLPHWLRRLARHWGFGLLVLFAVFAVASPPPHSVLIEMLRVDGTVVAPYLTRTLRAGPVGRGVLSRHWRPWLRPVEKRDAVKSTHAGMLPEDPVVILLTIDSLRADTLSGGAHDKKLPTLARLRDEAVRFSRARSPGSQTVTTLASLFMGTYYSQQYWTRHPDITDLWPHRDETERFVEILSRHGVETAHFASTKWLVGEYGIVRGFRQEQVVETPGKFRYALSRDVMPLLVERLRDHDEGPMFVFAHLMDAHYVMSPAGRGMPRRARQIENLALIDAQLERLLRTLERSGLADRTLLILTSDHGEGFGEHGTKYHSSTVYEELIRVPLLFWAPWLTPRQIDQQVTLVDVGPTVLDLMGQTTPPHFMGTTLAGLLRGDKKLLSRPIVAEGHLKKTIVFSDQYKIIVDDRYHTAELYKLDADPQEMHNLFEERPHIALGRLRVLRAFFEAHTRPDYQVPYRR